MNLELVEQIVVLLGEYPVSEIAVESERGRVHVRRPLASAFPVTPALEKLLAAESPAEEASEEKADETRVLTAPMVGIFYHAEPPWTLASEVRPGQVVGCIESMKLLNDVTAEDGGQVTEVLVEDGAPVEYGQALFRLSAV